MQVICFMKQQGVFHFRSLDSLLALGGASEVPPKCNYAVTNCKCKRIQ